MANYFKIFFSIIIFIIIYKLYNIHIDISIVENLNIKSLFVYGLFFIFSILIISIRWMIIIRDIYKITFVQSIKISLLTFSLNNATLSGSGDLFKIFLWNKKIKKNVLLKCIFTEKIFGLLTFLSIVIFIVSYFIKLSFLYIFGIITIYLILFYYLINNIFLIKKIPYINYYEFFLRDKVLKNPKKLIGIFLLSLLIQIIYFTNLYIFCLFNYKNLINIYSLFYYSLISLANSVPLFFSGFGIRELLTSIFLNYAKLDSTIYFEFILIVGLLNLFIAIIILFLRFIIKSIYFRSGYNIRKYKS